MLDYVRIHNDICLDTAVMLAACYQATFGLNGTMSNNKALSSTSYCIKCTLSTQSISKDEPELLQLVQYKSPENIHQNSTPLTRTKWREIHKTLFTDLENNCGITHITGTCWLLHTNFFTGHMPFLSPNSMPRLGTHDVMQLWPIAFVLLISCYHCDRMTAHKSNWNLNHNRVVRNQTVTYRYDRKKTGIDNNVMMQLSHKHYNSYKWQLT